MMKHCLEFLISYKLVEMIQTQSCGQKKKLYPFPFNLFSGVFNCFLNVVETRCKIDRDGVTRELVAWLLCNEMSTKFLKP